ncbi:MAG: hypothetical protein PHF86_12595 [Candidatus Nanoarchaeia archaeon]|nr:hypothetical protein [Candidatus Nanoarchaeia archaeon]
MNNSFKDYRKKLFTDPSICAKIANCKSGDYRCVRGSFRCFEEHYENWEFLQTKLQEAGFVQQGTICGCLLRFVGDHKAFDAFFALKISGVRTQFGSQTYFTLASTRKVIFQPEEEHYSAWCA